MTTFTFETYVERNEREYAVEVEYRIVPGCRATTLTPAEPETVEITALRCDIDLTDAELDELEDEAFADAQEAIAEMREAAAEYAREAREEAREEARWMGRAA